MIGFIKSCCKFKKLWFIDRTKAFKLTSLIIETVLPGVCFCPLGRNKILKNGLAPSEIKSQSILCYEYL